MTETSQTPATPAGQSKIWNHHPDLPIRTSPVFAWPPRPLAALKWLAGYWLAISMVVIEFALACLVWTWLQPGPQETATRALGWIGQIYLRNLTLIFLFAGGLHLYLYLYLYLYRFSRQGKALKFDARALARNNGTYSFRDQVLDNMFWTIASGVTVWTAFEVLYFWASANGYTLGLAWSDNPIWFVLMSPLIPIWSSFHFYWIHRALHWPPLYRLAHSLHHRNVNIGPWTGISMHPVEHVLNFSSVLIHFVIASHPIHFLFHIYFEALNPLASHSGFDGLQVTDRKRFELGDFFHQLHRRYLECNYGTAFRSRGLNETCLWLASLVYFEEPYHRRWSHTRHHTYTWHEGLDSQMPFDTPMTFTGWLGEISGLTLVWYETKVFLQNATGNFAPITRAFTPESELPHLKWSARACLAVYGGLAGIALAGSWWPLTFLLIPRLAGGPVMLLFALIQHVEMHENAPSILENTRSFRTGWLGRFLYMNMNNHIEHHLYPQIPFHALPGLNQAIADQLPKPDPGFFRTNWEVLEVVTRRSLGLSTKAPTIRQAPHMITGSEPIPAE